MSIGSVSMEVDTHSGKGASSRLKAECDPETGLFQVGCRLIDSVSGILGPSVGAYQSVRRRRLLSELRPIVSDNFRASGTVLRLRFRNGG